ncbi:MAG TPA: hypothetical protein VN451_04825, partial [Chitinophagaceae bacterium]|nr:hypothetical protein [Chitinophagaceae bacterium]
LMLSTKLIKAVFNDLDADTIDFIAYHHYGRPGFENFEFVLLYISKSDDGKYFFHQKYQFDVLFRNRKGKWRGEKGKSIGELFNSKKEGVLKARGIFN